VATQANVSLQALLVRVITQPIDYLTQVADRISMGELDIKIEIGRKDEIGELADAFERTRTGMQVALNRLCARRTSNAVGCNSLLEKNLGNVKQGR
jgi:HAMP domain-containing protein